MTTRTTRHTAQTAEKVTFFWRVVSFFLPRTTRLTTRLFYLTTRQYPPTPLFLYLLAEITIESLRYCM